MNTEIQPITLEQFTQIVYQAARTRYRHFSNKSVEKEQIDYEIEVFSSIPGYIDYLIILKGLVDTKFGASPPSLTAKNPVVFSEHHHPNMLKTL